jgi:hypothetical protein
LRRLKVVLIGPFLRSQRGERQRCGCRKHRRKRSPRLASHAILT